MSTVFVSCLAEMANAFQVVHWSYRTIFESFSTRRKWKPRRNIDKFTKLISF